MSPPVSHSVMSPLTQLLLFYFAIQLVCLLPKEGTCTSQDGRAEGGTQRGVWGHKFVSPPRWHHPPKIHRHSRLTHTKEGLMTKRRRLPAGAARIVQASNYELEYVLGRKIIFMCVARGNPRPRISWYKDGVELYAHNYFQVHEWDIGHNKLKSKMEIDPATPMDVGYYECQANNKHGVDYRGFRTLYNAEEHQS